MRKLLTAIIDLVFPPRESEILVRESKLDPVKKYFRPGTHESIIYLGSFTNPTLHAAIVENKYFNNRKAATLLAELLLNWQNNQSESVLFVPVPLGTKRLKERGYNQVENILKAKADFKYLNYLRRIKETKPQTDLTRLERHLNMNNVFGINNDKSSLPEFKSVVVIDDVVTTGETLKAAGRALKPHLAPDSRLILLAIVH